MNKNTEQSLPNQMYLHPQFENISLFFILILTRIKHTYKQMNSRENVETPLSRLFVSRSQTFVAGLTHFYRVNALTHVPLSQRNQGSPT